MREYKLIIFDCDGTLVDSEAISNQVVADMFVTLGVPMSMEKSVELFAGKKFADIVDYLHQVTGEKPNPDFEKQFRIKSKSAFEKNLTAIPGVKEYLGKLSIPYCVASNGPREKMDITLRVSGLDRYFDQGSIFSAYDIKVWKPDPGLFLHAADQMGVSPKDALVIEDTISGLEAAVNANMDCLIYCPENKVDLFNDRAMGTFSKWEQLETF